jgi:hypothetical protein
MKHSLFNIAAFFISLIPDATRVSAATIPCRQSLDHLVLSQEEQTVLTAYNLFFADLQEKDIPDKSVMTSQQDSKIKATKARCKQPDMQKCMVAVGGVGAATCALSGIETLGFTCIGALVGGGIGSASCFYKHCHFV